eukprot:gb/GFBE01004524.1/.p1 GENE.gb/GFBE01004524.1/~~gb/GFBE01004524.1/.p1  ORF type:complete len:147 (+),score=27.26 gb/GFBE01004524.1/:1-441(+)
MGCVASTVEEHEINAYGGAKDKTSATKQGNPDRTLLTSMADSPKAGTHTVAPPAGARQSLARSASNIVKVQDLGVQSPVSPGKSILRSKSLTALQNKENRPRACVVVPDEPGAKAMGHTRSVKRRVTFGQAEAREYRVQLTHSQSF